MHFQRGSSLVVLQLSVILIALASVQLSAQDVSKTTAAPDHFRWSESYAHELNYDHTLATANELSPELRKALSHAIRKQLIRILRRKDDLDDESPEDLNKLVARTRIELLDLNGDGNPEILAQANGIPACGATGNCSWLIFEQSPVGLKLLLETTWGFEVIAVRPWKTNSYRDIVLGAHVSATERELDLFKYDGAMYRRDSCYWRRYTGDHGEDVKIPWVARTDCGKDD